MNNYFAYSSKISFEAERKGAKNFLIICNTARVKPVWARSAILMPIFLQFWLNSINFVHEIELIYCYDKG